MLACRSADARIALRRMPMHLIGAPNEFHARRQARGRTDRELGGAAFEPGARSGSQLFGPADQNPADQYEDVSPPPCTDSSIGRLALCGFRRFSVGSIHWCRCLVVVILR